MNQSDSQPAPPLPRRRFLAGAAGAVGTLLFFGCTKAGEGSAKKDPNVDYYTCTMHPSVRSQDPKGKCPICGMDLVPVLKSGASAVAGTAAAAAPETNAFDIPPERLQAIGVSSGVVAKQEIQRPLSAPAKVGIDEAGVRDVNVKSGGYIVKLYAGYVGKPVIEGQPLMTVLVEDGSTLNSTTSRPTDPTPGPRTVA